MSVNLEHGSLGAVMGIVRPDPRERARPISLLDIAAEHGVAAIRERMAWLRRDGEHAAARCIELELGHLGQFPAGAQDMELCRPA